MHQKGLQKPRTAAGDEFYPRAQLSGVCLAERASPWYWYKRGFQSKCLQEEPGDKIQGVGRAPAPPFSVSARTYSPESLPEPVSPSQLSPTSSITMTRGCPGLLSRRTLFQGTPPLGPQHPPWSDAGWVDGIFPCRWCKHMEEFWGVCAGTLREPCGWVQTRCRRLPAPLQLWPHHNPPSENVGSLMSAAEAARGMKSCSPSLLPGFEAPERCSHGTGCPSIPLLGGSPAQTAEQGMQAAASSCPQPCAGTCLPPAAGAQLLCP